MDGVSGYAKRYGTTFVPALGILAAIAAVSFVGVAAVLRYTLRMETPRALALAGAVAVILFAVLAVRGRMRTYRWTCTRCGAEPETCDRRIGLPIEPETLSAFAGSDVRARLGRADWSPFESATPRSSIQDWVSLPAVFVTTTRCAPCAGTYVLDFELHGIDAGGTLHLGTAFQSEVDVATGDRLVAIARSRGLMTYGHA